MGTAQVAADYQQRLSELQEFAKNYTPSESEMKYPFLHAALQEAANLAIWHHLLNGAASLRYTTNHCVHVGEHGNTVFGYAEHSSEQPYAGFKGGKPFDSWVLSPLQFDSNGNPIFVDYQVEGDFHTVLNTYTAVDSDETIIVPRDVMDKWCKAFADYAVQNDEWNPEFLN